MKAILMTAIGEPGVLKYQDIKEPEISEPTQIKVKLQAAGVNPVDTKIRHNGVFYDRPLPAVLGCDGAGIVVETGEEVSQFKVGDNVWFVMVDWVVNRAIMRNTRCLMSAGLA